MKKLLIIPFLLTFCSEPFPESDQELIPYLQMIDAEAAIRGIRTNVSETVSIQYKHEIYCGTNEQKRGCAYQKFRGGIVHIDDYYKYDRPQQEEIEIIIWHEVGHTFGFDHTSDSLNLMNDLTVTVEEYRKNKKYLIDKFFGVN